jgi:hypothetical protein
MNNYLFRVDVSQVAQKLRQAQEIVQTHIINAVESVSVATHAFIVEKANELPNDFLRNYFLGVGEFGKGAARVSSKHPGIDDRNKNVRWIKASDNLWIVEIDEKAKWIEEGRASISMATEAWLLKPGKVKTAKDGSVYRSIPFTHTKGGKPTFNTGLMGEGPGSQILTLMKKAAQAQGISLTKIERDESGEKIGGPVDSSTGLQGAKVLHKLNVNEPSSRAGMGLFYSKPRTQAESIATGLKPHGGIYHLQGAVVTQREVSKGKFSKEVVTFRTVSSKHQGENRWMAPEVKALNSIPAAYKFAEKAWEEQVKILEQMFNQGGR